MGSFDAVDAPQQEGLTARLLTILRGLYDDVSYMDGKARVRETAYKLLGLSDDEMDEVRVLLQSAENLVDARKFRSAFTLLSTARSRLHWPTERAQSTAASEKRLDQTQETTTSQKKRVCLRNVKLHVDKASLAPSPSALVVANECGRSTDDET